MGALIDPHGGVLKNLYLDEAGVKQEKARARDLPSWDLNMRQICDIEMLLNGAFSPLEGFLSEADYRSVLSDMRLTSGVLWPMPITLDVTEQFAEKVKVGDTIALRDGEGVLTATMEVSSLYRPDFGPRQAYRATITRAGVDIGATAISALTWAVFAPTVQIGLGDLSGNYGGVAAGATVGVGLGANVLYGGSNNSVALQPLSVEGSIGLNVFAGIAGMALRFGE